MLNPHQIATAVGPTVEAGKFFFEAKFNSFVSHHDLDTKVDEWKAKGRHHGRRYRKRFFQDSDSESSSESESSDSNSSDSDSESEADENDFSKPEWWTKKSLEFEEKGKKSASKWQKKTEWMDKADFYDFDSEETDDIWAKPMWWNPSDDGEDWDTPKPFHSEDWDNVVEYKVSFSDIKRKFKNYLHARFVEFEPLIMVIREVLLEFKWYEANAKMYAFLKVPSYLHNMHAEYCNSAPMFETVEDSVEYQVGNPIQAALCSENGKLIGNWMAFLATLPAYLAHDNLRDFMSLMLIEDMEEQSNQQFNEVLAYARF